jgi:hypothetical protein
MNTIKGLKSSGMLFFWKVRGSETTELYAKNEWVRNQQKNKPDENIYGQNSVFAINSDSRIEL